MHCRSNFGGFWELDHASYAGGLDDMVASEVEWWMKIINTINRIIHERKEKDK